MNCDQVLTNGDRIVALTKERDDYILKQKIWEEANDKLRSAHIRDNQRIEHIRKVANTSGVRSEEMADAIYAILSSAFTPESASRKGQEDGASLRSGVDSALTCPLCGRRACKCGPEGGST